MCAVGPEQEIHRHTLLAGSGLATVDRSHGLYFGLDVVRSLQRILVRETLLNLVL